MVILEKAERASATQPSSIHDDTNNQSSELPVTQTGSSMRAGPPPQPAGPEPIIHSSIQQTGVGASNLESTHVDTNNQSSWHQQHDDQAAWHNGNQSHTCSDADTITMSGQCDTPDVGEHGQSAAYTTTTTERNKTVPPVGQVSECEALWTDKVLSTCRVVKPKRRCQCKAGPCQVANADLVDLARAAYLE